MGNASASRSENDSLFRIGVFSNPTLIWAVLLALRLQLAVIDLPPMQTLFRTAALSLIELIACLLLSVIVFAAVEFRKFVVRAAKSA